jgi:hypothetical protein
VTIPARNTWIGEKLTQRRKSSGSAFVPFASQRPPEVEVKCGWRELRKDVGSSNKRT